MVRWKMLERIGAYVAGELSGEEAREVERLIREDPEALSLAESYARLLACLSAAGRESSVPPPAIVDHAVRNAADDTRARTPQARRRMQQEQDKKTQERKTETVTTREEHEPEKDLGLIWVSCPCKEAITLVGEALGKRARVYVGERPPEGERPSSVVFCPKGEGVAQGVRRLRALAPEVPVLLFGLRVEPKLARTALLAGAHGFIHPGMQPAQVARALSAAAEGETIVPRELLKALLVEMEERAEPSTLAPHQREILERLCVAASFGGEIAVSRELLETFLVEVATV